MRRSSSGGLAAAVLAVGLLVIGGTAASAGLVPTLVKGGSGDQNSPTANSTTLGYSANSSAHPRHFDAFVESFVARGVARTKVNARHTVGYMGHMNGDSGELVYQQIKSSSDVLLYDIETDARTRAPNAVNTDLWEWSPSLSSGYILFGRNSFRQPTSPWKVILYDRETNGTKVLASSTFRRQGIWPGQVTDAYATWTKCTSVCNVWYYDILAEETHKVPNPQELVQYWGGVSEDTGQIYFASSAIGCGGPDLMRWDPAGKGDPVVVTTLPSDQDLGDTMYVFADGVNDDLFFTQARCTRAAPQDIYKVENADLGSFDRSPARPPGRGGARQLSLRGAMPGA